MGSYFVDSSALVKRQIAEQGHAWVTALCSAAAGNAIVIAELTLVEIPAAYSRMVRETPRRISPARRDRLIADFDRAVAGQYIVVVATRQVLRRAVALCRLHPLRAYDAVQLACALTRLDDDAAAGLPPPTFVSGDIALLAVAQAVGFSVENPNAYP